MGRYQVKDSCKADHCQRDQLGDRKNVTDLRALPDPEIVDQCEEADQQRENH